MRNPNSITIQGCGKETPYGRIVMKSRTTCNHELQIGKKTTIAGNYKWILEMEEF